MEELKHEHEMRERRNQERERWRDGRASEISAVSSSSHPLTISDILKLGK